MAYCLVGEVTVTRWDFMAYLEEIEYYDRTNPLELHDIKDKILRTSRTTDPEKTELYGHLKNLVMESYEGLEYDVEFADHQERITLFPRGSEKRKFHVIIHFKDMKEVNKFKLKHPRLYREFMND